MTRAYRTKASRNDGRSRPLVNLAEHSVNQAGLLGWLDARDYGLGGTLVETPVMRAGSSTQALASKQPLYLANAWTGDGGPCFAFDGANDCWQCGTSIDIGGLSECTLIAVCNATATITTGEIWEYTTGATLGVNGAYIAFRIDGGDYHPFAVLGDAATYAGSYLAGDYDGLNGCLAAFMDRAEGSQIAEGGGTWEGAAFDTQNGTGLTTGNFAAGQSSWIGARNNGAAAPFGGQLRSLTIYNSKLSGGAQVDAVNGAKWLAGIL